MGVESVKLKMPIFWANRQWGVKNSVGALPWETCNNEKHILEISFQPEEVIFLNAEVKY